MRQDIFEHAGQFTSTQDLIANLSQQGFARHDQFTGIRKQACREARSLFAGVRAGRDEPMMMQHLLSPNRNHRFIEQEFAARYPAVVALRETMATSDYAAYLTTDLINIMLWGGFQLSGAATLPLVKKVTLTDFKTVKRLMVDGAIGPFEEDKSDGHAPAPQVALTPVAPITYEPVVYQRKWSISWKALLNDNLGIFNDLTNRALMSWQATVADFITKKYWASTGPHTSLFNAGFRNLVTTAYGASSNNPPLSFQALADAYTVILKQVGPEGEPIDFNGTLYLVVPEALAVTALALKNSVMNQLSILGGNQNSDGFPTVRLNVTNGVLPNFEIIVDKRIKTVVTTGTVMNTAWMLVYDPNAQNRPTVEMGMLRDFDTPSVMQRVPDTMRVGGGVDARMGAFDSGNIDYKSVLVMGGAYGDGRSAVASTGQGS